MRLLVASTGPFEHVVHQKFLDEIDMRHNHTPAAVSFQAESVKSFSLLILGNQKLQICLPLVANDLATGETPNGNNHVSFPFRKRSAK
eukprot:CAMPEP_0196657044 /NCGR_PEP_ID=MMETSP1086-20130531/21428_1 /TAXON_ID=77921 /ORGANISM="Cyanoptyche  gloeocystis , Strain SAG4.97" /LENGTH=87 /DNA_ID=CAMNT_0041990041 /DNA_START=786 /DNA_END=1046 /DNA_ORIENTATION=+